MNARPTARLAAIIACFQPGRRLRPGGDDAGAWRNTLIECMRLGFADAQQWVCDRAHAIPLEGLASREYADRRRPRIDRAQAAQHVPYGSPLAGSDTVYLTAVDATTTTRHFINSLYMGTGSRAGGAGHRRQPIKPRQPLRAGPAHPSALAPNKRYQTIIPALTITQRGQIAGALHALSL